MKKIELHWQILIAILLAGISGWYVNQIIASGNSNPTLLGISVFMFVCTANTLDIPAPLLDRMEIIELSGYTEDEKINIANKYLLPKQIKDNGVKDKEMKLEDDIIKEVIRGSRPVD